MHRQESLLAVLLLRYTACLNLNILIYKKCIFGDTYPTSLKTVNGKNYIHINDCCLFEKALLGVQ